MKFNTFQHFFDTKFSFASLCYRNKNLSIMVLSAFVSALRLKGPVTVCLLEVRKRKPLFFGLTIALRTRTPSTYTLGVVKTQLVVTRYCTSLKLFR